VIEGTEENQGNFSWDSQVFGWDSNPEYSKYETRVTTLKYDGRYTKGNTLHSDTFGSTKVQLAEVWFRGVYVVHSFVNISFKCQSEHWTFRGKSIAAPLQCCLLRLKYVVQRQNEYTGQLRNIHVADWYCSRINKTAVLTENLCNCSSK
jgi:hypothetical protein